jgi:hypothetical protein
VSHLRQCKVPGAQGRKEEEREATGRKRMTGEEICYIVEAARREGYEQGVREAIMKVSTQPNMQTPIASRFAELLKEHPSERIGLSRKQMREIIEASKER